MMLDPDDLSPRERYRIMIGAIVPRPIAWVSSMDAKGRLNLAPFSFFNAVCANPPTLMFCPGVRPSGEPKDTWRNILEVPEFVVHLPNQETAEAMNRSATEFSRDVSEFEWAGVTPIPSDAISVPRVAEAPVAFECTLHQIAVINEGPGGGAAIFGEVQRIHFHDGIYDDGRVDLDRYQPIGRLFGSQYSRVTDTFDMVRLPVPDDAS
jgi:flavin reductase (DIM6/NTAB) family NADH-FMN oxidoreductase RutF